MQTSVDQTADRTAVRRPALHREVAMKLAADEYERVLAQLRSLSNEDWSQPTDCPAWDGGRPDSPTERWIFGFLVDVVLTRDPWMHRTDIAAATGAALELSAEHDGVLVADVVEEWATRHGQPYRLLLTGPAGGSWSFGTDGETLELDAVRFCRTLAGRGAASGLLAVEVPF